MNRETLAVVQHAFDELDQLKEHLRELQLHAEDNFDGICLTLKKDTGGYREPEIGRISDAQEINRIGQNYMDHLKQEIAEKTAFIQSKGMAVDG